MGEAPSRIKWEVCVDWDATDWSDEPDFSQDYDQISGDVDVDGITYVGWARGKQREEGNAPAGTCEIRLKPGLCQKYSPFTNGILKGKIRPWLPIRVRSYFNGEYVTQFTGFISRITIDPHPDVQSVIFYCTDGTDLLARQEVTQDTTSKDLMSDGAAVERILDTVRWNANRRSIDKDGGSDLLAYPKCYEY